MNTGAAAKTGWALALLFGCQSAAHADAFKGMAKELGKAAQHAKIRLVAILPLEPADSSNPREGWSIAEKLTTQFARQKRVQTIERNLLKKLMGEAFLGETGAVELPKLRRVGKVLSVDAIVTGSFVTSGNEALVDVRLIDAQTGAIISAVDGRVRRDWHDPLGLNNALAPMPLDPWAFGGPDGEPPLLPPSPPESVAALVASSGLRDSLGRGGCEGAAETVDTLESRILDLKARYWATQLKEGLNLASLRHNPGSTITDPLLKRKFYERMKSWYALSSIPKMSAAEVKLFTDVDQKAFQLHHDCGL